MLLCQSKITRLYTKSKASSVAFDEAREGLEQCNGALSVVVAAFEEQYSPCFESGSPALRMEVSCEKCKNPSHPWISAARKSLSMDSSRLDLTTAL